MTSKTNYFAAAKNAARNARKSGLCQSAQHRIAIEVIAAALPNKSAELWQDLGWQAVLAAQ